jgi:hypothetical protein
MSFRLHRRVAKDLIEKKTDHHDQHQNSRNYHGCTLLLHLLSYTNRIFYITHKRLHTKIYSSKKPHSHRVVLIMISLPHPHHESFLKTILIIRACEILRKKFL